MFYQIHHIIYGYYCGAVLGVGIWWPWSYVSRPILKYKKEDAEKLIKSWITNGIMKPENVKIEPYDDVLNQKITIQGPPQIQRYDI